jgi:hypothetical protein
MDFDDGISVTRYQDWRAGDCWPSQGVGYHGTLPTSVGGCRCICQFTGCLGNFGSTLPLRRLKSHLYFMNRQQGPGSKSAHGVAIKCPIRHEAPQESSIAWGAGAAPAHY